ncbi:hypothetical protein [Burkholderia ambifaria]|uniref:hypothetical protein n=1 Tax=Burkholderia ambifaria TaxID=152480 RepID=UPI001C933B63|nr:hypothetical protein [Burkholderia ambifaria]MBY4767527.1 hypothetical protein [Burkholderia ambifaria]
MTLTDFIAVVSVPLSLLAGGAGIFAGIGLSSKEERLKTIKGLQAKDFGRQKIQFAINTWSHIFERFFGSRYLARRQLLSVPIYTVVMSIVFFSLWIAWIYLLQNPEHRLGPLPIAVRLALSDFYGQGILACMITDVIAIQLTKRSLRKLNESGIFSARFVVSYAINLIVCFFMFTVVVFVFRVEDMVRLYMQVVPHDPMPKVPYTPFEYIRSSIDLFHLETTIYVTSRGWLSMYFMPQSVILYCAIATQSTLVFMIIASGLFRASQLSKIFLLSAVRGMGTPQANANGLVIFFVTSLFGIAIGFMVIFWLVKEVF